MVTVAMPGQRQRSVPLHSLRYYQPGFITLVKDIPKEIILTSSSMSQRENKQKGLHYAGTGPAEKKTLLYRLSCVTMGSSFQANKCLKRGAFTRTS